MSARVCVCVFACLAVEPLTLVPYDCRHKPGLHGKPGWQWQVGSYFSGSSFAVKTARFYTIYFILRWCSTVMLNYPLLWKHTLEWFLRIAGHLRSATMIFLACLGGPVSGVSVEWICMNPWNSRTHTVYHIWLKQTKFNQIRWLWVGSH